MCRSQFSTKLMTPQMLVVAGASGLFSVGKGGQTVIGSIIICVSGKLPEEISEERDWSL